ncbi:MAG: serine hydrolase [Clostridiaceae bacterium]|nr:serine hydrolase [Clostridiaceae bacterium]
MKTVKKLFYMFLALSVLLSVSAFAISDAEIDNVVGAILYEATTDTILFEKNADKHLAPASMTKVMTAILVLEKNPTLEGDMVVAEEALDPMVCSDMEENHLVAGETVSVEECMNYMLIPSGNEGASALACYVGGTVESFVAMMNRKAADLGCKDTQFRDPIGLVSGTHYTTCRDMLTICKYAMSFEKFRGIVDKLSGTMPKSDKRDRSISYTTTNKILLPGNKKYYERAWRTDVAGIKTGTTAAAGECFSGYMNYNGLEFYSVCMFGHNEEKPDGKTYRGDFLDTLDLYDWARTLTIAEFNAGETVGTVAVTGGIKSAADIIVAADVRLMLDGSTKEAILASYALPNSIRAPLKAGDEIAELTVTDAGGHVHAVSLVAASSVVSYMQLIWLCMLTLVLFGAILLLCRRTVKKDRTARHG